MVKVGDRLLAARQRWIIAVRKKMEYEEAMQPIREELAEAVVELQQSEMEFDNEYGGL